MKLKIKKKYINLHNISILVFMIYIVTLYTFVDHPQLFKISQIFCLLFLVISVLELLRKRKLYIDTCTIYFYVLSFMFLVSFIWANNKSVVVGKSFTIVQISVLCVSAYHILLNEQNEKKFIDILYIAGMCMCIYSILLYGPSEIINSMMNGDRLGAEINQENTFGMNAAMTTIICFYKGIYYKKKHLFFLPLPFIMAMSSGSRKALVIIVLGMFILLFIKYGFRKIFKLITILVTIGLLVWIIMKNPIFTTINERMEGLLNIFHESSSVDNSTDIRRNLISLGIEKFRQRPLLGYGTSHYALMNTIKAGYYSHNNFVELLVNNGLVGFIVYYYAYVFILFNLFKLIIKKDRIAIIIFVLISVNLIIQMGVVVYYDKLQYLYIVLGFVHIKKSKIQIEKLRDIQSGFIELER